MSSYIGEVKEKENIQLTIKWNIKKNKCYNTGGVYCRLYEEIKLATVTFPDQKNSLNKINEILMNCKHKKYSF